MASLKVCIMDTMAMFNMTELEALNLLLKTYDFTQNEGAVVQVNDQVFDAVSGNGKKSRSKHQDNALEALAAAGIKAEQGATISLSINDPDAPAATFVKNALAIVLPCGMANEGEERNHLLAVYFQMDADGGVTNIFVASFRKSYARPIHRPTKEVSERSERALLKTRAMNPSIWLQTATSTTKLPSQFVWLARFARPSSKMGLASLGAGGSEVCGNC